MIKVPTRTERIASTDSLYWTSLPSMSLYGLAQRFSLRVYGLLSGRASLFGDWGVSNARLFTNSFGYQFSALQHGYTLYHAFFIYPKSTKILHSASFRRQTADKSWRSVFSLPSFKKLPVLFASSLAGWIFPSNMNEIYLLDTASM